MPISAVLSGALIEKFTVPVDENGFVDWLIDAEPGDAVAYYRGHLGHDRMPSSEVLSTELRRDLHAVAKRVLIACDQGLVIPVQKRIGREDFLYLAVRRLRPSTFRPAILAVVPNVCDAVEVPALAA